MFDTSNLTVILMGSFDELYAQKKKYKKKTVGFNNPKEEEKGAVNSPYREVAVGASHWLGCRCL